MHIEPRLGRVTLFLIATCSVLGIEVPAREPTPSGRSEADESAVKAELADPPDRAASSHSVGRCWIEPGTPLELLPPSPASDTVHGQKTVLDLATLGDKNAVVTLSDEAVLCVFGDSARSSGRCFQVPVARRFMVSGMHIVSEQPLVVDVIERHRGGTRVNIEAATAEPFSLVCDSAPSDMREAISVPSDRAMVVIRTRDVSVSNVIHSEEQIRETRFYQEGPTDRVLWDWGTPGPIWVLDGDRIASLSGGQLSIQTRGGKRVCEDHSAATNSVTLVGTPGGERVFGGYSLGHVAVFGTADCGVIAEKRLFAGGTGLRVSRDGALVVAIGDGLSIAERVTGLVGCSVHSGPSEVVVLNRDLEVLARRQFRENFVMEAVFSPNGESVLIGSSQGDLINWDWRNDGIRWQRAAFSEE